MASFVWVCIILSLLLILVAAIVLLAAAQRLMSHLNAVADAAPLRDAALIPAQLSRLEATSDAMTALASRATAARELLSDSLRRLKSPLFYFGRLP